MPDPALHLNITPNAFGGAQAKGLEEFGQSALSAGDKWGQIAADDVSNQYEDAARKIVYGDPDKTVTNADGTTGKDEGYLGLKGGDALDQRATYEKSLEKLRQDARSKLSSPNQQYQFDQMSRRYTNIVSGEMGRHAVSQAQDFAVQTAEGQVKTSVANAALWAGDDELFKHAAANIVDAQRKLAQLKYGAKPGDAIWTAHEQLGYQIAAATRVNAVGAMGEDGPVRAMEMAKRYKTELGDHYHVLVDHYRARAETEGAVSGGNRSVSGIGTDAWICGSDCCANAS